jgi:hypothetical protein
MAVRALYALMDPQVASSYCAGSEAIFRLLLRALPEAPSGRSSRGSGGRIALSSGALDTPRLLAAIDCLLRVGYQPRLMDSLIKVRWPGMALTSASALACPPAVPTCCLCCPRRNPNAATQCSAHPSYLLLQAESGQSSQRCFLLQAAALLVGMALLEPATAAQQANLQTKAIMFFGGMLSRHLATPLFKGERRPAWLDRQAAAAALALTPQVAGTLRQLACDAEAMHRLGPGTLAASFKHWACALRMMAAVFGLDGRPSSSTVISVAAAIQACMRLAPAQAQLEAWLDRQLAPAEAQQLAEKVE